MQDFVQQQYQHQRPLVIWNCEAEAQDLPGPSETVPLLGVFFGGLGV